MKNSVIILMFLMTLTVSAQESKFSPYVAAGVSLTNSTNFANDNYASVEFGLSKKLISYSAVFGRSNLVKTFGKNESLSNYWYGGKVTLTAPFTGLTPYILVGYGTYINNKSTFIEYGIGMTKPFKYFSGFTQISNWDSKNYLSLGVSINL